MGLSLYAAFGSFPTELAANTFSFVNNFALGITIATLISVFGPKTSKVMLGITGILLVRTDALVVAHPDLRYVASTCASLKLVTNYYKIAL